MPNTEKHTEKIKCPDCGTIQDATVEHTIPFHTYLHNCEKCNFTIMESDWEVVPNTEKQMTACQMLINYMEESYHLTEESRLEFKQILATERQQHESTFHAGFFIEEWDKSKEDKFETYYNETFKPNK